MGWRKRLSADSKGWSRRCIPMIAERKLGKRPAALDGGDPSLAEIADELNFRLGHGADQGELWDARRVRRFPVSMDAGVLWEPGEWPRRRPLAIMVEVEGRRFVPPDTWGRIAHAAWSWPSTSGSMRSIVIGLSRAAPGPR